ncbi:MAG: ArsA family ATPase [Candidatus Baldrarchaeia archaeon]
MGLLSPIFEEKIRFVLFGGKGGVGKTTCAAATALWLAERGMETLVISTDPAHSLSDSFDQKIGGEIRKISGIKNLYALEVDPNKAMKDFRSKMSGYAEAELSMSMGMGIEEFEDMFSVTAPGVDEALAFAKVLEFIEKPEYDVIVFDTAPTGHTLRLLSLPDVLDSWIGKLIKIRLWFSKAASFIKRLFSRREEEEDRSLEVLEALKETIRRAKEELSDLKKTRFVPVMIPEMMAIYETERLLRSLYEYEIPVTHVIVNMIHPKVPDCSFCRSRYEMQRRNLEKIVKYYDDFSIVYLPLFPNEVRGLEQLRKVARYLFEEEFIPT